MADERSQRSNFYRSFMIRLIKLFILCYKLIEVEHFPSSEEWMTAAINQVGQLILTPATLCLLCSLIRNTSPPHRDS